jgi:hypothetical protein
MFKRILFFCALLIEASIVFGQQDHFLFFQSDASKQFYVRMNDKVFPASPAGHLTISSLKDSTYNIYIGVPGRQSSEQQFRVSTNKRDRGFQVRNAGEANCTLFDFISLELIRPVNSTATSGTGGVRKTDSFAELMASVVSDSAVLYTSVTPEEPKTEVVRRDSQATKASLVQKESSGSKDSTVVSTVKRADTMIATSGRGDSVGIVQVQKPVRDTLQKVDASKKDTALVQTGVSDSTKSKKADIANKVVEKKAPDTASKAALVSDSIKSKNADIANKVTDKKTPDTVSKVAVVSDSTKSKNGDMANKVVEKKAPDTASKVAVVNDSTKSKNANIGNEVVDKKALDTASKVAVVSDSTKSKNADIGNEVVEKKALDTASQIASVKRPDSSLTQQTTGDNSTAVVKAGRDAAVAIQDQTAPSVITQRPKQVPRLLTHVDAMDGKRLRYTDSAGTDTIEIFIPVDTATTTAVKDSPATATSKDSVSGKRTMANDAADSARKHSVRNAKLAVPNSDCTATATDADVDKLRVKMLAVGSDDDRIVVARKQLRLKCLTTRQVRALSELFPLDEGRYKFFDAAYAFVTDTFNFRELESDLKDEYYRNRFRAMLRN